MLDEMQAGNLYIEDPMECSSSKQSKGRFKLFRSNYLVGAVHLSNAVDHSA